RRFFGAESKQPVSEGSRGPVFTVFGTQIGGGTGGGSGGGYEEMGREVGALTLRLLRGGPMPEGPVRSLASSVPIFDWRQLRRWHLDESRPPAGGRGLC